MPPINTVRNELCRPIDSLCTISSLGDVVKDRKFVNGVVEPSRLVYVEMK